MTVDVEAPPLRIAFTVYGQAAPAGSKRHVGGHRIIDASKRSAPWKNLVAEYAAQAMASSAEGVGGDHPLSATAVAVGGTGRSWSPADHRPETSADSHLLAGPLAVKMTFYVPRPKGHYSTAKRPNSSGPALKFGSPVWPITRPDVLKLARAVEDACTGIIWRDDAQIVDEQLVKKYGEPARVEIVVMDT